MKSLALASKPQVLENCPVIGSRTALFFEALKFCWKAPETSQKICKDLFLFSSSGNCLKKIFEDLFCLKKIFEDLFLRSLEKIFSRPFFWRTLAPVSMVLGLDLERVCTWPWPRNFFCVLGLAPCVLDSTSGTYRSITLVHISCQLSILIAGVFWHENGLGHIVCRLLYLLVLIFFFFLVR